MFHCPPALQEKYDEPEKHVKLQSINHNAIGKDFGLYGDRLGDLMDMDTLKKTPVPAKHLSSADQ